MGKTLQNELTLSSKLNEFERVYRIFDVNGDGHLTRQEIADALEVLDRDISQTIAPVCSIAS